MSRYKLGWSLRLIFIIAFSAISISPAASKLFNPKTFVLKNGLKVIVLTNKRAPVVKQFLVYKVGAMDEEPGKSGLAHFLEHLMFKGTPNVSGQQFVETIVSNGGSQNAGTSNDNTVYYQVIHKDHLETIIRLESDRMNNLTLSDKDVETERPVILEERKMRIDNEPLAILNEAVNASFYQNHPYRIPTIGWENEMEGLTHKDALEFYRRWYAPNNAVLVFSGDITVEEVKPLVEKYYGTIPSKTLPERKNIQEPQKRGVLQHLEKRSDRIQSPLYMRIYHAPTLKDDKRKTYAIAILDQILSDGANSLLYDSLVTQKKIAVSIDTNLVNEYSRGPGSFMISGQPAPGKTVKELEDAILLEIKKVIDKGISVQDIETAKKRMVADIDYILDDSLGGAELFGYLIGNGFEIDDVENWQDRIEAVKPEEVNQVARELFHETTYLTAYLLPDDKEGAL